MKRKRTTSLSRLAFAAACLFLASVPAHGQLLPPIEFDANGAAYMRGEVLVQFKPAVTDAQIGDAFRQAGLNLIKHVHTPAMKDRGQIGLTHAMTSLPVPQAVRMLNNLPGVQFAEPNWIYHNQAESSDPLYVDGSLWGMFSDDLPSPVGPPTTTNPFGSQVEKAWAAGIVGSRDVFVGVIDQGIQFDHPDLAANIWTNPGEIPGNGVDDDGNGYVDDVHGWNAIDDNGTIFDPGYDDHGTHVAGTIGALGGNGIGVAGVNWNVTLISGKFLGRSGSGSIFDAIQAIDYMTALKTRKGLNIVALNNSYGGGAFSQAFLDSITRAAQAGVLFAVAAMNAASDNDTTPVYPSCYNTATGAGYDSVIAVAAIDKDGNKASFSNYGQTNVDLGAAGASVISTIPDSYGVKSGTSMATPHVAGAIALYASTHPAASALETRNDLLTSGVRPLAALQGITVTGGTLDAAALAFLPSAGLAAPSDPANLQVSVLPSGYVSLSWTDQADNELGFAIERSTDGLNFILANTSGANFQSGTDGTVQPGATYYYRIRAYNPGGSSGYAYAPSPVSIPPITLPAAPSNLTGAALARGSGVRLSWSDRSNNELGFQLERRVNPTGKGATPGPWQLLITLDPNMTTYVDTSAVSLTSYTYRLRAFNLAGVSAYSNEVTAKAK